MVCSQPDHGRSQDQANAPTNANARHLVQATLRMSATTDRGNQGNEDANTVTIHHTTLADCRPVPVNSLRGLAWGLGGVQTT